MATQNSSAVIELCDCCGEREVDPKCEGYCKPCYNIMVPSPRGELRRKINNYPQKGKTFFQKENR